MQTRQPSARQGVVAVFVVLAGSAALVRSDDLAALARKEKARRAAIAKPVRVLTEDDAKVAAATGAGSGLSSTPGEGRSAAPPPQPPAPAGPDPQQAQWKERADAARAAITEAESTLATMERDLVTLRSDLTQLSAADAQDPMRLQKRDVKVKEALDRIEIQKGVVANAKKALILLQDQARRSGIPAGWLR